MKTIAVRLDQNAFDLLTTVSQLEATTIVDQIRVAITAHLERKVADGELASRAQAALDDIDREASARKEAIGSLIGSLPKGPDAPKARSGRGAASESEASRPSSPQRKEGAKRT